MVMLSTTYQGVEYRFFDHLYAVSACGRFLRKLQPHTPAKRADGYLCLGNRVLAHRIVATCWCERPEGANHVHHINGDKTDNRAENLEWVSPKTHIAERHLGMARGHTMSEEGKQRLRTLRLGSKASEATKAKQREATLRLGLRPPPRAKGTKMPPGFSALLREASGRKQACEVDGVRYASFSIAGEALGMRPHTLRKRCLSENFPSYKLAD